MIIIIENLIEMEGLEHGWRTRQRDDEGVDRGCCHDLSFPATSSICTKKRENDGEFCPEDKSDVKSILIGKRILVVLSIGGWGSFNKTLSMKFADRWTPIKCSYHLVFYHHCHRHHRTINDKKNDTRVSSFACLWRILRSPIIDNVDWSKGEKNLLIFSVLNLVVRFPSLDSNVLIWCLKIFINNLEIEDLSMLESHLKWMYQREREGERESPRSNFPLSHNCFFFSKWNFTNERSLTFARQLPAVDIILSQ